MTQNDANSFLCIDKISKLDFFEKLELELEHYVHLRVYLVYLNLHN